MVTKNGDTVRTNAERTKATNERDNSMLNSLRAQNDALEARLDVQLDAVREAARRIRLLERQRGIEREAAQLAARIRQIEGREPVPQARQLGVWAGYWRALGI